MQRCPSCWSTLEADAETCPQCGAAVATTPPPRTHSSAPLTLGLVVGAVLGVFGTLVFQHFTRVDRPTPTAAPQVQAKEVRDRAPDPTQVPVEEKNTRRRSHVLLRSEADPQARLLAVVLRPSGDLTTTLPPTLLLPFEQLPLRGALLDGKGQAIDLRVVHADERAGFALLVSKDPAFPPGDLEPLQTALLAQNDEFQVVAPDGTFSAGMRIQGRSPMTQRLLLATEVVPGSVLLDAANRVVAYATTSKEALALEQVGLWLGRPAERTLAETQKLLRSRDPEQLLHDGEEALLAATKQHDVGKARDAIALFEQGLGLARGQELVRDLDTGLRAAWVALVRNLFTNEPVQALAEGLRGTARLPDHWPLLADTCQLQLEHGDAVQALGLYARLAAGSQEHAQAIAEPFVRGVVKLARARLRERRVQEALDLLDRAVGLFPQRADLLMVRADALAAAGRVDEAAGAAAGAAALDQSYAKEAEALRTLAQRSRTPGVVQIPFDPATNVVNANVTVSGRALHLVVDTGASLTTIPSALADELQLRKPENRRVKVNTASGTVEGEVVTLPSLVIGQIEVKNVQAVVLDLPDSLAGKGLLGLNVLQRLNMEIDSQNGMLVLKQGRERRGR